VKKLKNMLKMLKMRHRILEMDEGRKQTSGRERNPKYYRVYTANAVVLPRAPSLLFACACSPAVVKALQTISPLCWVRMRIPSIPISKEISS